MGLILENAVVEAFCVILILLWSLYSYVTQNYNYWRERGVPYVDAVFPFGTLPELLLGQCDIGAAYDRCYKKIKGERFFGVIDTRVQTFVVKDPDLIKHILVKDFHYFIDRIPLSKALKNEYILNHLFNLSGQDWRKMRLILTPSFTSGKMKMMFSLVKKCSDQLQEHMDTIVETNSVVDVKDILSRFTMDIIATCAFGLEINSLSDKDCKFYQIGKEIFTPNKLRMFRRILYNIIPCLLKLYVPRIVSATINDFFSKIVSDTVNYRELNNVIRNDFLDLLIKRHQNKSILEDEEKSKSLLDSESKLSNDKTGLTIEEIIAQSFIFFAAGFETSSSTAAFCLYELACNPNVQEKLNREIEEVLKKHGGKPTYEALKEMPYMDQVINETLRRYASLSVLNRTCTESYKIPGSEVILEKGTRVAIPIFSIHHDKEYFPEPYKFDPERFTAERMKERHPYVYLPFGEGPRMCIGTRFGMMQTRISLITMVYNYKFGLTPETEIPIKLNKRSFTTQPEKQLFLEVKKRRKNF